MDSVVPFVTEPRKQYDPSTAIPASLTLLPLPLALARVNRPDFPAIHGITPGKDTIVLVTGASSWVGAYVARALIDRGYPVRAAVERLSSAKFDFLREMGCTSRPPPPAPLSLVLISRPLTQVLTGGDSRPARGRGVGGGNGGMRRLRSSNPPPTSNVM